MAKKATKKDTADNETPESTSGNWFTRLLFRPNVLWLLAVGVAAIVLRQRLIELLPDLSRREEYRLRTAEIEVTDPPHWVPHDLVAQVIKRSGLPEEMSLLDDRLTSEIAEAFRLHPWVAEVVEVRKLVPGRVLVELNYRQPVAMVAVASGLYPVDAGGTLLPPDDFTSADAGRYPLIRNVQSTPQGPAGSNWGDVAVTGAARLAQVLAASWKKFDLDAILVPRRTTADVEIDEMTFELATRGGSRIVWGRAPGSGHPGELTEDQKIGRLEDYLQRYGSFDGPHGPYEIDIRHWQEISRRRLTSRRPPMSRR